MCAALRLSIDRNLSPSHTLPSVLHRVDPMMAFPPLSLYQRVQCKSLVYSGRTLGPHIGRPSLTCWLSKELPNLRAALPGFLFFIACIWPLPPLQSSPQPMGISDKQQSQPQLSLIFSQYIVIMRPTNLLKLKKLCFKSLDLPTRIRYKHL